MKKTIVIASTLKPVDDVRAYEKLAQSMAKTNKYEVNIIGNDGKSDSKDSSIIFYPHSLSRNSWLKRILIREKVLCRIIKLRPELLIISTHELINIALIAKWIIGCKVVYDVQENYSANAQYLTSSLIKKFYSKIIRLKELISRSFIDQYWLAEKCYQTELKFVRNRFHVIENKAVELIISQAPKKKFQLLFSGTISNYGGVKKAILVHSKIQEKEPSATLKIIGQIHDLDLKKKLEKEAELNENITLQISTNPIAHSEIINAILESNLGIIGYEINIVNQHKTPTKLYEYSRYQLPYLVHENTTWDLVCSQLGGAIFVDFSKISAQSILELIKDHAHLFPESYPYKATWEYESEKLIDSISALLS